ncbi:MAG: outer membrane protein assembly factor BamC [Gammaproteobacteria bacterium]|nr:outer membrane protein assembly factor BamC [Gammaproteobacteria bacterium]
MNKLTRNLIPAALALALTACGSVNVDDVLPDKAVEYKREQQAERNLEIPPDLTSDRINDRMSVPDTFGGLSTSYSEYLTDRRLRGVDEAPRGAISGDVLPVIRDIQVRRDGDERWLQINAPVETVWQKVVDFWQENGILMAEQDPTVGVMRTSWLENRAEIPRNFITDTIRRAVDGLYDTGTRDQYRVRLERTPNNGTELYLTHYGMQEQVIAASSGGVENTVWTPRERDPGLEGEMLRRLMVYMGATDERARARLAAGAAEQRQRSQLLNTRDGTQLLIDESFNRAWRIVGLTLDRVGFAVEDRDRSSGIYYVRYNDPSKQDADKGWLSRLAFWSNDDDIDTTNRYQVKVGSGDGRTVVVVADEQGQRDNSPTAIRILTLLQEQIR